MRTCCTLLICLFASCLGALAQNPSSIFPPMFDNANAGTDFTFSVPPAYAQSGTDNRISIFVSAPWSAEVTVEIKKLNLVRSIKTIAYETSAIHLSPAEAEVFVKNPNDEAPADDVFAGAGIRVHSDLPIVAHVELEYEFTGDGAMLIPDAALGTEYVVSSYPDVSAMYDELELPSETTVTAIEDGTTVWFTLGGNALTEATNGMKSGETRQYTLNAGDVLSIATATFEGDVSGSYVRATKPVAVYSGNQCANVPTIIRWCDYILCSETPMHAWGKTYHFPTILGRQANAYLQIMAAADDTEVLRDGVPVALINGPGGVRGVGFYSSVSLDGSQRGINYSSDKAINITWLNPGTERDGVQTEPFAMPLIPVEQYSRFVWLNMPHTASERFQRSSLSVIYALSDNGVVPPDLEILVRIGGTMAWTRLSDSFGSSPGSIFPGKVNGKTWAEKRLIVADGTDIYAIRSLGDPFAVYLTGVSGAESYGMRAAARFNDLTVDDHLPPINIFTTDIPSFLQGEFMDVGAQPIPSGLAAVNIQPDESYNLLLNVADFTPGTPEAVAWTAVPQDINAEGRLVVVLVDRAGNSRRVEIHYTPKNPGLGGAPAVVEFGATPLQSTRTRTAVIQNLSESEIIQITDLQIIGGDQEFALASSAPAVPFTLAPKGQPGDNAELVFLFTPQSPGHKQALVWISSNIGNFVCILLDGVALDVASDVRPEFTLRNVVHTFDVSANPAPESVQLSFELETSAQTDIVLYNLLGIELMRRRLGVLRAGPRQVQVQLGALPIGSYFGRIIAGDAVGQFHVTVLR